MKNSQGFIALTAVLIVSAIFLSISISTASRAIARADTNIALYEQDRARYRAEGCIEHALIELERQLDYQGDGGIIVDGGYCYVRLIQGVGNTNRILETESTVGAYTYRIRVDIEAISPQMKIRSYERVAHF